MFFFLGFIIGEMICGLIDLNTVDNDDDGSGDGSEMTPSGSELTLTARRRTTESVCMELWHACAGPLISLPKKGSGVVYLPQGHLEQLSDQLPLTSADLPPHVFCRVLDVKLHVSFDLKQDPKKEVLVFVFILSKCMHPLRLCLFFSSW